jgi:poly(hydroxyalkanoate) depolymerase family esterase
MAPNVAGIQDTIDRALASAGIDQGIRTTIDDALASAGLSPNRTHAPEPVAPAGDAVDGQDGAFITRTFTNDAGTLTYKVYIPAGYSTRANAPVPLVVMLHGCTQSPDDFAAGTRMNQLADTHGFLVAYPAQATRANGSKCWNWFRSADQRHGAGEPSLIAGITQQVAQDYRIDADRIYVAGLSAGAAMAVILGQTYPDVFAAIGAHSGLPFAVAHDVGSAFAAMKGGQRRVTDRVTHSVPTIVFHGDADHTVAVSNGDGIVDDAIGGALLHATTQRDAVPGGRAYIRDVFTDADGRTRVEHWRVHGAGHAWSGGSGEGTYTDPTGPDASAEMIRFFLQQKRAAIVTA